jgi:hypothetical protein
VFCFSCSRQNLQTRPVFAEGRYQWEHAYIKKATAVAQVGGPPIWGLLLQYTCLLCMAKSACCWAHLQVRDLAKSKKYDVFLNLCDGAFDEVQGGC